MNNNQELPTFEQLNARLDVMAQNINESYVMLEELQELMAALKSEK